MFEIGRVCLKTAGRDAGKFGAVIKNEDSQFVLLDGFVRRRKVNIKHLEPTSVVLEIKAEASTDAVIKALEKAGFEQKEPSKPKYEKKDKEKKSPKEKPRRKKKGQQKDSKRDAKKETTERKEKKAGKTTSKSEKDTNDTKDTKNTKKVKSSKAQSEKQ